MRLSANELEHLEMAHQKAKSKKEGDKIKCLIAWGQGYSWEVICDILLISVGTIKNYIDAYEKGGLKSFLKTSYHSHNHKLTLEEEKLLSGYIDRNNVLSSAQVCAYVKRRFAKIYTTNGMTQTLKRLGFSYKKPKRKPGKSCWYRQFEFWLNFHLILAFLKENESLYCLDATGFEHNSKLDYGWMRKGKDKYIKSNSGRQRLNVNGAYNPKTNEVITICQKENMNSETNILLMDKILKMHPEKKRIVLVLDNAPMNKSKKVKEFVEKQNGRLELYYLPVYSPNLNLIERLWRFSKKKLLSNKYYASFTIFRARIEDFFERRIHRMNKDLTRLMTPEFELFD